MTPDDMATVYRTTARYLASQSHARGMENSRQLTDLDKLADMLTQLGIGYTISDGTAPLRPYGPRGPIIQPSITLDIDPEDPDNSGRFESWHPFGFIFDAGGKFNYMTGSS